MTQPYTITLLSDLHLTASDSASRSEPKLFGKLTGMNKAFRALVSTAPCQQANLVLVTGDVTDRGDIGSWHIFWDAINKAGLAKRILVVPGNHDMCCLGWRIPEKNNWQEDLQKVSTGLKMGLQPIRFPWIKRPADHIAVFGLNSNNYGNWNPLDNAIGNLGKTQLNRLESMLKAHQHIPAKIVALHHSPNIPRITTAWRREEKATYFPDALELPDSQRRQLREICRKNKVKCIVHGHVHINRDRRVEGLRIIGSNANTQPNKSSEDLKMYSVTSLSIAGSSCRMRRNIHNLALGTTHK